jgi:hypothetical protein
VCSGTAVTGPGSGLVTGLLRDLSGEQLAAAPALELLRGVGHVARETNRGWLPSLVAVTGLLRDLSSEHATNNAGCQVDAVPGAEFGCCTAKQCYGSETRWPCGCRVDDCYVSYDIDGRATMLLACAPSNALFLIEFMKRGRYMWVQSTVQMVCDPPPPKAPVLLPLPLMLSIFAAAAAAAAADDKPLSAANPTNRLHPVAVEQFVAAQGPTAVLKVRARACSKKSACCTSACVGTCKPSGHVATACASSCSP